ncbi:hypothetical protein F0562_029897 [Nyssa sinensis]|uniref:Uncharacterized protein n=1 Tax=Nyssa sinensis TaxID=561372 RepID=A0A5J5AZG1_9ASTE|nr:hypothetical protein F0562_029897 [Nyssa sinensis]
MGRAPCCDKSKVKRGPWSPDEDITLKNYLERYGTGGNWIALPHKAGLKRCGKSCRLRWLNYLRPDIKHGGFTEEEDNIILNLYRTIGSRWSVIASHLQGRTDNDVKNYWNTKLKKKLMPGKTTTTVTTTTTNNNNYDITTNNCMHFSYGNSANCSDHINSKSLPYYDPMKVNYDQQNFVPQTLVSDPVQLPLPRLMEVHENGTTHAFSSFSNFSSPSQEVSSVSTVFSPEKNNASWYGNGGGEGRDGFLMDSSSDFPYDLLNYGFDFQEKTIEVYSNLATQQF